MKKIYVPVDNSDYSDASIALSVAFARRFGSQLVGSHVYAAKMHDVRFKQMEYTLPEEYQDEVELEKQRRYPRHAHYDGAPTHLGLLS